MWLERELPAVPPQPARDAWTERRKWDTDWQRRLFDAGYAGLHWPKEFGGRGASPTEQLIFYEETARARAPYVGVNFVGTLHAGPTLIEEGSDEQKAAHLPKILRGEEVWCQGFSEPGAGSDLASLRTRAERDGDDYVLNGQKIWCSFGQVADVGEFLVRTDPDAPKHRGISWLILPMDTARHRDPAAQDRARQLGVLRGVPHRRARAGRQPGRRRERRLARHQRHAEVRAGHRVRERARRLDPAVRRPRAARARSRANGGSSAGARRSSTRCGRSRSATSRRRRAASSGRARW